MSTLTLHEYQSYCENHILKHESSLLLLQMGLGKTLITLTALDSLKNLFELSRKILIIAPLQVAKHTWESEINKWGFGFTVSKVLGSAHDRRRALKQQADLYIINRENIVWLVEYLQMRKESWPFDTVVVDELSSFKSNQSKRFKSLRKVMPKVKRFIGLTGTPAPNNLLDLWPQVYLADQGERLERTITKYRTTYFYPEQMNGHVVYKYGLKPDAEETIHRRISDIAVSMKSKDYLNLPPRTDNSIALELNPKQEQTYRWMERDLFVQVDEDELIAANAGVLSGKLLQMANGAVYDEHKDVIPIHDEKVDALQRIVEDAQGEPLLVFYQFQHDRDRILKRFKEAQLFNDNIEEWNQGDIPILLVHPASAGHGLNLQDGGHTIVWFGLNWSLELYQQANARLDRQGQQHPVVVHHLITKGTIDEDVMAALARKEKGQDALMQAVKARLEKVNEERHV